MQSGRFAAIADVVRQSLFVVFRAARGTRDSIIACGHPTESAGLARQREWIKAELHIFVNQPNDLDHWSKFKFRRPGPNIAAWSREPVAEPGRSVQ